MMWAIRSQLTPASILANLESSSSILQICVSEVNKEKRQMSKNDYKPNPASEATSFRRRSRARRGRRGGSHGDGTNLVIQPVERAVDFPVNIFDHGATRGIRSAPDVTLDVIEQRLIALAVGFKRDRK